MPFNPNPLLSTEEFIKASKEIHGDYYDYSLTNYTGSKNKVTIICPAHGSFEQEATSHKRGAGCNKCGQIRANTKQTKTTETFIKEAKSIHGDKYDYSKSIYIGAFTPIEIICKKHGSFLQPATAHISSSKKAGCPTCANIVNKFTKKFYTGKQTIFYVLHLTDSDTFKVGITTTSINHRYRLENPPAYTVVFEQHFFNGLHAWLLEKAVIKYFKKYKYTGKMLFKYTKNSEIFTLSPINFITQRIINGNFTT